VLIFLNYFVCLALLFKSSSSASFESKNGVISFSRDFFSRLFLGEKPSGPPQRAEGPIRIDVILIEADVESGRTVAIERVFKEYHEQAGS